MINDKEIQEAERNISGYLEDDLLKKDTDYSRFVSFFQNNAKITFQLATFLMKMSTEKEIKKRNNFPEEYECLLWVVVAL